MLIFSDMLYMLVRYVNPSGPMWLRCLMLSLSCPVEYSSESVCYVCDPSVCIGVPSICQICVFV